MIGHAFTLVPFPDPQIPAVSLIGNLVLENHVLVLRYSLSGDIESVLLPAISVTPGRKDDLWKATCFEFFLAIRDQPGYWEFNMSPSGDWNVYRVDAYRRVGFREETAVSKLPFALRKESDGIMIEVSVNLSSIIPLEAELQIGITAIVQEKDGRETYWALAHPAPYADFHLRESFILALAGQTHPLGQSARDGSCSSTQGMPPPAHPVLGQKEVCRAEEFPGSTCNV